MRILHRFTTTLRRGPFNSTIQTRFKKPANTAQTRLETRTRDPKLDLLTFHHRRLELILTLHRLVSAKKRGPFFSVQLLSRWAPHAGIDTLTAGAFIRKYPHVFKVFTHPIQRNVCCKFTRKFVELLKQEDEILCEMEDINVVKIRKILMMSVNGKIHLHAIRLIRRELGLPEDFRESIIRKYDTVFRLVDLEIVELIDRNENNESSGYVAEVELWREKEYREKWLSEFETKYAFPINFPTGFKIVPGFREKLRNWQRLPYVKPYERMENVRIRTCGGVERYEKRAVGIIHELLCLMVEKMVEVERLAHFRKDLGVEVNIRELLLKQSGIFYVSTRGNVQMVYLREAYSKGCLVEPNPVYDVRRKMLELILLGCRYTRELREWSEVEDRREVCNENALGATDGDFVLPILESFSNSRYDNHLSNIGDSSVVVLDGLYEEEIMDKAVLTENKAKGNKISFKSVTGPKLLPGRLSPTNYGVWAKSCSKQAGNKFQHGFQGSHIVFLRALLIFCDANLIKNDCCMDKKPASVIRGEPQ
ncbi:Ubiquitin carboxyl-terminal hydrolase family protein [Forsythia ovata]|uniref:Ubiquitin carboxyl-terminal hydrolase family protein n=1 Tax=Forsythia ovata TaxID=205694 RepID=A0ABD1PNI7_9LAMI